MESNPAPARSPAPKRETWRRRCASHSAGIVALAAAACFGWSAYVIAADFSNCFRKLRHGMTREQVRELLGEPDRTLPPLRDEMPTLAGILEELGFANERWVYVRSDDKTTRSYWVYFDGEGKATRAPIRTVERSERGEAFGEAR